MDSDENQLQSWIGRSQTVMDTVGPTPVQALHATLDHAALPVEPGSVLPPLWHWLYFLPPVPLPRRMWAGSEFEFRSPIRVGDRLARSSTIDSVRAREGRSGKLVFVRVRHALHCNSAPDPALLEFHDIVYREARRAGESEPPPHSAPTGAPWQREIVPDDVLLFRYSALTFNGHRIHYDRRYVTEVEGYPGLVVHGPLIATLLLDLLQRELPGAEVAAFRFRALRPSFDLHPLRLNGALQPDGRSVRLWAQDHEGWLTMDASATLH